MKTFENENATTYRRDAGKVLKVTETVHETVPTVDAEGNAAEETAERTVVYFRTFIQVPKERAEDFSVVEIPDQTWVALPDNIAAMRDLGVELGEIKEWFSATDYIPNKVMVGEWEDTDPRWLAYKEERTRKRARQDEILKEMGAAR